MKSVEKHTEAKTNHKFSMSLRKVSKHLLLNVDICVRVYLPLLFAVSTSFPFISLHLIFFRFFFPSSHFRFRFLISFSSRTLCYILIFIQYEINVKACLPRWKSCLIQLAALYVLVCTIICENIDIFQRKKNET